MSRPYSPTTHHEILDTNDVQATLALFGYSPDQLSDTIIPARVHAGADHYVLALKSRGDLAAMAYELNTGRDFMRERGLVTIMWVLSENDQLFHVRNAFASGGVFEDPATGAAAAAFAGYLRDSNPHAGKLHIIQGEDMGARSFITTEFSSQTQSSIRVSGATRHMD